MEVEMYEVVEFNITQCRTNSAISAHEVAKQGTASEVAASR